MWLIEWLKNTWQEIVAGVSISTLVAVIFMIVKNAIINRSVNKLAKNLTNLTSDLSLIAGTKDEIAHNSKSNANLVERVSSLEVALLSNNKAIEAMLSVMGVVYMRSKDEDVRSSVASILSTFKDGDITIRNLKLELEHVKEQLSEALAKVNAVSETKEEQVQETNVASGDAETRTDVLLRG